MYTRTLQLLPARARQPDPLMRRPWKAGMVLGLEDSPRWLWPEAAGRANYLQGKKIVFSVQKLSNLLSSAL